MKQQEVKVRVELTEGYEKRFTEACLEQLRKRNRKMSQESNNKEKTA